MRLASSLPEHPLLSHVKGNRSYPPLCSIPGFGQIQGLSFLLRVMVFGDMQHDNIIHVHKTSIYDKQIKENLNYMIALA